MTRHLTTHHGTTRHIKPQLDTTTPFQRSTALPGTSPRSKSRHDINFPTHHIAALHIPTLNAAPQFDTIQQTTSNTTLRNVIRHASPLHDTTLTR